MPKKYFYDIDIWQVFQFSLVFAGKTRILTQKRAT
jgi:hypothetical protein